MAAREQSGIYTVTCRPTGRLYVGQSQNMRQRMLTHRSHLRGGKHANPRLQSAFNAHGESAFDFEVLVACDIDDLDAAEQYWMNLLQPAFNLAPIAGSRRGVPFTDDQRRTLREAFAKPETKKLRSEARLAMWADPAKRARISAKLAISWAGRKPSAAFFAAVRSAAKQRVGTRRDADFCAKVTAGKLASGFVFSDTSRQKMRQSQLGKKQSAETKEKRRATWAAKRTKEVIDGRA